ncbi:MAG TPA: ricin-type beta-trefoil lectin domain protein [Candidatus Saccharimonadales bacterium]|nr:ricin-type beta-trefoil lectin domain protein [Candidatus Saccharimonadales bacterium]
MPKNTKRKSSHKPHWRQAYTIAFVFAVGFGLLGSYLLKESHALSNPSEFQVAFNQSICMDNKGNVKTIRNPIVIWKCSPSDRAQQWNMVSVSGGFLLKNDAGTCADDTGGKVGTSASDRVYLITWTCNPSDHAQIWQWTGSTPQQLKNAYNNGCINDPANSTTNGQQLIIYPCSPVTNNARWYRVNVTAQNTPSITITAPSTGTVTGTGVLISGKASVPSGSITTITLLANGTALRTCANATTCYVTWNSTTVKNGTYQIQVQATSSGGGSAAKSESVTVSNATPSPPPPGPSPSPHPGPGPSPHPGPGPSPSPTPSPSPSPFSGSGSGSTVNLNPSPSPTPGLDNGQPTDNGGTIGFDNGDTTTTDSGTPLVANIQATSITKNSIALSWEGTNANTYEIKYGTNKDKLDNTRTFASTDAVPTYTLTKLDSGKTIYIQITPASDTANGAAVTANFKTKSPGNAGAVFLWIFLTLIVVIGVIMFLVRRRLTLESSLDDPDIGLSENAPVYPREDSEHESERLNWWMPEEQRHQAAQNPQTQKQHKPEDDIPDMYEQGRKRLDDEDKH